MRSAGLLPYRIAEGIEVLIAHPGGPYFAGKQLGAWSVVKGLVKEGEDDESAAIREFTEETGWEPRLDGWVPLGETTLRSRKVVIAWGFEADFDLARFNPGTFTLHGRAYPEIDVVEWVTPERASRLLNPAQHIFVYRLASHLDLNVPKESR